MSKGIPNTYQHFVPRCYLKHWGHEKDNQKDSFFLYCYNKAAKKSHTDNVDKTCGIDDFYTISQQTLSRCENKTLSPLSTEKGFFAENVESNLDECLPQFEQACQKCVQYNTENFPLSVTEKFNFAHHIVIQFVRHPNQRSRFVEPVKEGYEKMIEVLKQLVAKIEKDDNYTRLKTSISCDDAAVHNFLFDEKFVGDAARKLSERKWHFYYSPNKNICTSDNPVVVIPSKESTLPRDMGLNQDGSIVFYAILPELLLVITSEDASTNAHVIDSTFSELPEDISEFYHAALFENATNKIFNYNNNFERIKQYINGKAKNAKH